MTALDALLAIDDPIRPRKRGTTKVGKTRDAIAGVSEHDIQAEVVKAVRKLGFRCTASLNGIKLPGDAIARARLIAKLKRLGMEPGEFDLLLRRPLRRGGPDFGELEIKRPGQPLTLEQERRAKRHEGDGFKYGWCCDVAGALEVLKRWGWVQ